MVGGGSVWMSLAVAPILLAALRLLYRRLSPSRLPQLIILMRHGESEGNVDKTAYCRKEDEYIELTKTGKLQGEAAGKRLRALLPREGSAYRFIVSPYERTQQTAAHVLKAFPSGVDVVTDIGVRERKLGNLLNEEDLPAMRAKRMHFFHKFPSGESMACVSDRAAVFYESLHRLFATSKRRYDAVVVVTHGMFTNAFIARAMCWSPEKAKSIGKMGNCQAAIFRRRADGSGYNLITAPSGGVYWTADDDWSDQQHYGED
eukprot:PLAT15263.4.p1 GENE.PLAT15263.4~~PLAT15263.4.p1  ORF type:complete len:293 (-),score=86.28 PLAT15263.4:203-982(-)